jgi:multiple sugar transport system ATP-binding protein
MNFMPATLEEGRLRTKLGDIPLDDATRRSVEAGDSGRDVILGIRPETFEDAAFAPADLPAIDAEVVVVEELGSDAHVFFRVDAPRIATGAREDDAEDATDLVIERGSLLNARVDPRTSARVGETLRLAVDPTRFHFFEIESGASLLEVEQPATESIQVAH